MIDLHSHILPGLDDGPATEAESVALCRALVADGVDTAVASPHMFNGAWQITRPQVLAATQAFAAVLAAANVPLQLQPGADTHIAPDLPARVRAGEALTIADRGRYLLIELTPDVIPPGLGQLLFDLQVAGVTPILTHPERHPEVQRKTALLVPMIEAGAVVQITAGSVTGDFGASAQRCALALVAQRLAHVVASDAHHAQARPPRLSGARERLRRYLDATELAACFDVRPAAILAGGALELPAPRPRRRRHWWSFR